MSYCEGGDLATQAMRIHEIVQLWASAWQILTKEALHVTYDSYFYDLYFAAVETKWNEQIYWKDGPRTCLVSPARSAWHEMLSGESQSRRSWDGWRRRRIGCCHVKEIHWQIQQILAIWAMWNHWQALLALKYIHDKHVLHRVACKKGNIVYLILFSLTFQLSRSFNSTTNMKQPQMFRF